MTTDPYLQHSSRNLVTAMLYMAILCIQSCLANKMDKDNIENCELGEVMRLLYMVVYGFCNGLQ